MIKLVISDMDGTLLNSNHEIHSDFEEVFLKLTHHQILFAIASGRQYYNLIKQFKGLEDQILFIAENGTFIVYKGKEILVNALEPSLAKELIEIGSQIKEAYIILCGKKAAYIKDNDPRLIEQASKYYEKLEIVKNFDEVQDDLLKVTLCDLAGAETNSYAYYKDYLEQVQVTISGEIWLDITAKGVNKGVAIQAIQKQFGITPEETMVFGDYLNDLEMMDTAYHSYAMANAHAGLKKRARFEAKSNEENGVLEVIKAHLAQLSSQ